MANKEHLSNQGFGGGKAFFGASYEIVGDPSQSLAALQAAEMQRVEPKRRQSEAHKFLTIW